jgi:hypothetical protein
MKSVQEGVSAFSMSGTTNTRVPEAPDFYSNEASTSKRFSWQKHNTIGTRHNEVGTIIYHFVPQESKRKTILRPSIEEDITINRGLETSYLL